MNTLTKAKPLSLERDLELLKDAESYTYRSVDDAQLTAHCFFPEGHQTSDSRPAVIFFHGGLWDVSMTTQFAPHAMHFASRGMVAVIVEYRVSSTAAATPENAIEDAQEAMLWLKNNHTELGLDPNRITAVGAASGAHMALSLAMMPETETAEAYSPRPLSVIALSAIVDTTKKGLGMERFADPKNALQLSPSKLVKKGLCPMLLVHGKADTIVAHQNIAKFAKAMSRKKNKCELIEYEGMNHSFFNFNVSAKHFELTLNAMDAFLVNLDCIEPVSYL
ncbi:alpha/beta hydrolase [Akkermansiaceae bacterium]|jgi:acetyl esterase/lipase|nr:alpha/beta hydrolase [Akkermansiaceae bacterium]